MNRQSVIGIFMGAAAVVLAACAGPDAPPGPGAPTLSLVGARGVRADVRRTVSQIDGGTETVLSVVDTTVWAPFDSKGAALPSSTGAGIPGPVGWKAPPNESEWSRYGSFVDSAGVLHEIRFTGRGRGQLDGMEYLRQGKKVLDFQGQWDSVTGGAVIRREMLTFRPAGQPPLRVEVTGRQMQVAAASPFDGLFAVGDEVAGLLRPRPLAAQFFFGACTKEWLGWGGAVLLAELAWLKFLNAKSVKNFKLGMVATGAAGVALDKLVDCMLEQPVQPDPDD